MIGWICVHTVIRYFIAFRSFIPWIALILLWFIGGKMIVDGMKKDAPGAQKPETGIVSLLLQGIATSIDALSVGFAIAEYDLASAVLCSLIISAVTFAVCMTGLVIGKKFGTKFSNKATVFGGVILLAIGLEIFIAGVF